MNSSPEITRLLTKLASDLRTPNSAATARAIRSLAASLNDDGDDEVLDPRVRVLDAALSLMCFKTAEVCRARVECLVRTITSVLSCSISCRVVRSEGGDGAELLSVGSSISPRDCDELIRVCTDVLERLEPRDGFSNPLLYALLKLAISSSPCQTFFSLPPAQYEDDEGNSRDKRITVSRLKCFLPEEMPFNDNEIPFRMLFWYLDPSTLKHDVSEILREAIQRPFLCLKKELYDRMAWHSIVICLATSPTIFIETRALLHRWFLMTGLASVLDLQIGIVSSVLDILSRPMRWGISMELGLQIPFSYAYFPTKQSKLLGILNGSMSCKTFMGLVCCIKDSLHSSVKLAGDLTSHPSLGISEPEASADMVDFDSTWSLAMTFPVWFLFATSLLFQGEHSQDYLSKLVNNEVITEETKGDKLALDAAFYISWILHPINEAQQIMLADHIFQSSRSWVRKSLAHSSFQGQSFSKINYKSTISHSKKLQIPRTDNNGKLHVPTEHDSGSKTSSWLREFDSHRIKFCSRIRTPDEGESEHSGYLRCNLLTLKIPLGILLMCSSFLNENGCEVLLHYAATGEVVLLKDLPNKAEKWAMEGAHLVLNLLDDIEDLSMMLFDCEGTCLNFICQFKRNTCRYLLRCVNIMLEMEDFNCDNGVKVRDTMADLQMRLVKWKQQGGEDFDGCKAFEGVIKELNRKLWLS